MIKQNKLIDLYINKKLSLRQIGEKLECSAGKVKYWLDKYNIKTRSISKSMKTKHKNDKEFHYSCFPNKKNKNIKTQSGYIYILKAISSFIKENIKLYKIGVSINPVQRKLQLETKSFFEIKIIYKKNCKNVYEKERILLNKYIKHNVKGEWFKLNDNQLKQLKKDIEYCV